MRRAPTNGRARSRLTLRITQGRVRAAAVRQAANGGPPAAHVESARAAGLRYTTDGKPGIRRRRSGKGFIYIGPDGKPIRARGELERIRRIVIPPAWTDVWICPDPQGHLQATGRDARGRKQHRYHPRWREVRDETKYDRLAGFARALPAIRRRTAADLRQPGLPREKVLAAVVQLLEKTLIRVGNDEYARQNGSFGLTTMKDGHVEVKGARVRFAFRGKSGIGHDVDLDDPRLARIVRQCRELPGYDLFQYVDGDGARQTVGSADVNEYLRAITGEDYSSKDFRTWAGTVLAADILAGLGAIGSAKHARQNVLSAIESVAKRLGNTKAVCRKSYIHPAIFETYESGALVPAPPRRAGQAGRSAAAPLAVGHGASGGLSPAETHVLKLLRARTLRQVPGAGRRAS